MSEDDDVYYEAYKAQYGPGPHLTADAVVFSKDSKILLIERSRVPGKGLLALPGGFLEPNETFRLAASRELREETGIHLGLKQHDWINDTGVIFDAPNRSRRGRVITVAYLIDIPKLAKDIKLKAGDDAAAANWYDVRSLDRAGMFEDHYQICMEMRMQRMELQRNNYLAPRYPKATAKSPTTHKPGS